MSILLQQISKFKLSLYLRQAIGHLRPHSQDVDATALLEIATDSYYQNLICEYTGILAVAAHAKRIHPRLWVGFQSWRAGDKGVRTASNICFFFGLFISLSMYELKSMVFHPSS
jgi:hypothetical protein